MATGASKFTDAFLSEIPKTDLHMHLDGSMRISTIIELAKKNNVELPDYTVEGLRQKVFKSNFSSLVEYLRCFKYTVAVLQTSEALERAAYELACDNFAEGVRYFEVRFAPQLHAHLPSKASEEGQVLDIREVLRSVNRGLHSACDEWNKKMHARQATNTLDCVREPEYHCAIIVSALRMFDASFSEYYRALVQCHKHEGMQRIYGLASMSLVTAAVAARDEEGIPVVALDVAGAEKGHPARDHQAVAKCKGN